MGTMTMKCFRCAKEISVLPDGDPARDSDRYSYAPAFVVEVLPGGPGGASGACRAAVLCWSCMHAIDLDLWISEDGWNAIGSAVSFDKLPIYDHDAILADEPRTYAHVAVDEEIR
jgi:hypothetical protein